MLSVKAPHLAFLCRAPALTWCRRPGQTALATASLFSSSWQQSHNTSVTSVRVLGDLGHLIKLLSLLWMVNNLRPLPAALVWLAIWQSLIFHSDSLFSLRGRKRTHQGQFLRTFLPNIFRQLWCKGNFQKSSWSSTVFKNSFWEWKEADLSFEAPYDGSTKSPLFLGWIR